MLTFTGVDGMQSCRTCQRLKGKRMKASWRINNNLVPGGGNHAYECKGYYCLHFLITDDGQPYTVQPRNMLSAKGERYAITSQAFLQDV
jgi:hypothetical protein